MKIAFVTPSLSDPLSFYRGSGPLNHLCRNYDVQYEHLESDISWAKLCRFDLVYIQRPFDDQHLKVCQIANKCGIPIVGDFDDWLYDLPPSNPAHLAFKKQQKTFVQIVNSLDRIIVATNKLGEMIKGLLLDQNKPIDLIPNAYDVRLFKKYRHEKNIKERKMIFAWRGGNSHQADILSVKDDYQKLFKAYPQWQFVFIAQHPWILDAGDFPNVQMADPLGVLEYFRAFHDSAPSIVAHPLVDNDFNRCKSMCSWLESTHARAAFIGPDFEEFQRDGIEVYNAQRSFFDVAASFLDDPRKIFENVAKSEAYISKHLTLDVVSVKRMESLKAML